MRPRGRLLLLAVLLAALFAVQTSCDNDIDRPSELTSLRIVAVSTDRPFARPGDEVTLAMSFEDAAGPSARPIEVTWFGGCANPPGNNYYACYSAFTEAAQQVAAPEDSGVPDVLTFRFDVPDDVLATAPPPQAGPRYATVYVFFAVCAGTLQPIPSDPTEGVVSIPFGCFDAAGKRLGAADYVAGFTEIFVFDDGRQNANPAMDGLTLAGAFMTEIAEDVRAAACTDRAEEGCGRGESACTTYDLDAAVGDVAELDGAIDADGNPLREAVWVDYYVDGGSVETDRVLVSSATTGYVADHATVWTPPEEPGPVRIWAVAHDNRGGMSVRTGRVLVE